MQRHCLIDFNFFTVKSPILRVWPGRAEVTVVPLLEHLKHLMQA